MFNIQYKSLRLVPSKSASPELIKLGLILRDCRFILENGDDASRKRMILKRNGLIRAIKHITLL